MSNRSTLVDPLKLVDQVFDERYTVESVIGRGGMGVVYKAEHTGSSQTVALKVLYRQFAEREHQLKRFSLELKACSKLHHRNTVRVLDYGRSTTGYLFIAMEYLKGETLAEMLRHEKTVPRRRILRICSQICDALGEAHDKGIVHRDLKPDNVFLSVQAGEPDYVRLLDFGVAKITDGEPGGDSYTQTGFICGTPRYISPEQSLGKALDGRADLYSLGVMLFEMVTGAPLFRAETPIALVMKHVHDAPPMLEDVNPNVQVLPEMRELIYQLLEKRSSRRPNSALEVGRLLEDMQNRVPEQSTIAAPIVRPGSGLKRSSSSPGAQRQSNTMVWRDTSPGVSVTAERELDPAESTAVHEDIGDATQVLSLADVVAQIERSGGSIDDYADDEDFVPGVSGTGQFERNAGVGSGRFGGAGMALGLIVLLAMGTMVALLWTSADVPPMEAALEPAAESPATVQVPIRQAEDVKRRPTRDAVQPGDSSVHQAAAASRAAVPPTPSFVMIDSVPAASMVVIRGQIMGQTPYRFQPTKDTGPTTIIISRDGYLPESWHFMPKTSLPAGQSAVKLVLNPAPGVDSPSVDDPAKRKKRSTKRKRGKPKVQWRY